MSQGAPQNGGDSEIIVITIIAVVITIVIYLFNAYIEYFIEIWKAIRIFELTLFAWVPDWLPLYGSLEISEAIKFLETTPASEMDPQTIHEFDEHYSKFFSWMPALILGCFAVYILKKERGLSVKYNADGLLKKQAEFFPHLREFVDVNPLDMDLEYIRDNDGEEKHAMQLTPIQFCTIVPPMGLEDWESTSKNEKPIPIWSENFGFDRDLCEHSMKTQLGNAYKGLKYFNETELELYDYLLRRMPVNETALIDLSCEVFTLLKDKKVPSAKGPYHQKLINEIRLTIEQIETPSRVKIKRATISKLEDPIFNKLVKSFVAEGDMSLHGFNHTALMSLLKKARQTGVVPPLEVRSMLKGRNRTLWYCVQSVGRNTAFPEASGAFCHWLIEESIGFQLDTPDVYAAAKEMNKYMDNYAEELKNVE